MGQYDVAQVCPNGHVSNDSAARYPEHNQDCCDRCGEATMTNCQSCDEPIRGDYHADNLVAVGFTYIPPAFCHKCGASFPWTDRRSRAAIDLFLEDSNIAADNEQFEESIQQIARDTPQAQVASKRVTKLLGKIGKETASAIRDILVDVASETAKKILFPEP